jgi:hypothetical protein
VIGQTKLDASQFKLSKTSYTYTGKIITPSVTCTDKNLIKNADYTVLYDYDDGAGKHTVEIEGINDYKGTVKLTYTIAKASQTISGVKDTTVKKSAKTLTLKAKAKGKVTYKITSGSKYASINSKTGKLTLKGKGTVKVKITAAKTSNYKEATKTITIKIK